MSTPSMHPFTIRWATHYGIVVLAVLLNGGLGVWNLVRMVQERWVYGVLAAVHLLFAAMAISAHMLVARSRKRMEVHRQWAEETDARVRPIIEDMQREFSSSGQTLTCLECGSWRVVPVTQAWWCISCSHRWKREPLDQPGVAH